MQAKVKLFIEKDSQRALRDIEESKRSFKASLEALESQKRKEKLMFAKAINTLKRLYKAQNSAFNSDHSKFVEKLESQIDMLTEIKQTYDAKISELKQMDCSGTLEEVTQQIKSLEELNQALRTEIQVLKEN